MKNESPPDMSEVQQLKDDVHALKEEVKEIQHEVDEIKEDIKDQARETYREARPWVVRFGRFGNAAQSVIYLTLGLLILRAVWGFGSPEVDQQDALQTIALQPFFGPLLLGLIALGLAGFVLWQFVQAVADPQGFGRGARGLVGRGGFVVRALGYSGLVLLAVQILLGLNPQPNQEVQDWSALVLGQSFGPWLVGLVGFGFLVVVGNLAYVILTGKFRRELELQDMNESELAWAMSAGRMGLATQAILSGLIGLFLIQAAIRYNPEEIGGLSDALRALAGQPFGPWMLGGVAIGLIAYGLYTLILARYGRYPV